MGRAIAAACFACFGCTQDGGADRSDGDSGSSTTDGQTTIPVTSLTTTIDGSDTTPGTTGTQATDTATTGSMTAADSSSSSAAGSSSSTGPGTLYAIDWCRLQSPPVVMVAPDELFVVYARIYSAGLTDQSTANDPAPELVAEFGWGPDGSDPAVDATWTWLPGTPNPGWNGNDFGEPNNDEYQVDMTIGSAGTWDYCARFSGDSGATWAYCDLDDLLTGGYTPDQAGDAVVM